MGRLRRKDDGNIVRRVGQIANDSPLTLPRPVVSRGCPASVVLTGVVDEWRESPERVPQLRGFPEGQISDQVEYALLGGSVPRDKYQMGPAPCSLAQAVRNA